MLFFVVVCLSAALDESDLNGAVAPIQTQFRETMRKILCVYLCLFFSKSNIITRRHCCLKEILCLTPLNCIMCVVLFFFLIIILFREINFSTLTIRSLHAPNTIIHFHQPNIQNLKISKSQTTKTKHTHIHTFDQTHHNYIISLQSLAVAVAA